MHQQTALTLQPPAHTTDTAGNKFSVAPTPEHLARETTRTSTMLFNRESTLSWFNPTALKWADRFLGVVLKEGLRFDEVFPSGQHTTFADSLSMAKEGNASRFDCSFVYEGNEERRYQFQFNPVLRSTGNILVEIIDIDKGFQNASMLMDGNDLFRNLVQNSSDVITVVDSELNIRYMSPSVEQILGFSAESLIGMNVIDLMHPDDRSEWEKAGHPAMVEPNVRAFYSHRLQHADGSWLTIESVVTNLLHSPDVEGHVINSRDVTERQRHNAEMQKAARLESLGVLAGGIAHDFNNILLGIIGNISLARLHPSNSKELPVRLMDAERAAMRARDLTQQLLTFAKGGNPIRNPHHLSETIRETAKFVLHGQPIQIEFDIAEDLWPVDADSGQISQVLNNLTINALQAMQEGGKLFIRAKNVELETKEESILVPGRYVCIEVEDTGHGISKDIITHLFEPFFTTKREGSGLGLATSYSIINKHEGDIEVRSQVGKGSVFIIHLPASEHVPLPVVEESNEIATGTERILLMDDDEDIRSTTGELLRMLGYETVAVADGEEMLKSYAEGMKNGKPYQLVIADLTVIGGMGGKEAIQKLRGGIDPDVLAIVSSGYSNDALLAEFKLNGFDGMLAKPYRINALARVIRDLLDERNSKINVPSMAS